MKSVFAQFAPVAILGAGVLLVSGMREQYVMPPVQPMNAITATIIGFEGKDIVIDTAEQRVAGMSDYMQRNFGPDSAPLFSVYVGYYDRQVQGKTIHSPKNCLPGAGWETLSSTSVPLPGGSAGSVNRVLLANKNVRAMVYYWYQGRGRVASSEYGVKWDLLRDAALYGRTEEALVRIVVYVNDPEVGAGTIDDAAVREADAMAMRVAAELAPAVDRVMPRGSFGG
jgi:EpsI family protein